jgi:hypothetical protein
MSKIKHAYEIQEALELAECKENSDDHDRMIQTEWVRVKDVLEAIKQASRHDMNPKVCKGCNESHHYIACPYDVLMNLEETGKLNWMFEQSLENKSQEKQTEQGQ